MRNWSAGGATSAHVGAAGEIWNRQFSHAEEFVQNIRGSLLTKDGLCKFLHRADALEPAETLLLRLLPAAWLNRLNTLRTPVARQKGRFVTLACKKLSFCLAYEVKPRNRPHISSLSPVFLCLLLSAFPVPLDHTF